MQPLDRSPIASLVVGGDGAQRGAVVLALRRDFVLRPCVHLLGNAPAHERDDGNDDETLHKYDRLNERG